jgi:hypothetical protein
MYHREIRETTAYLRIIDISTEIRTEYLPNTSEERYLYTVTV